MRIIAITQKVLKELFRDKRTLAMMFIAPIFIMFLMNVMFSANNNTNVTIGTINVENSLITNLDKIKHVKAVTYDNVKAANNDVKKSKIDAYFSEDDTSYHIRYANTDSSKTVLIKQAVNTALNISKMKRLSDTLTTITSKNPASQKLVLNQNKKIKQSYNYGNEDTVFFAKMIPILMGFMVFFFVFLISGMALLKERTSGTLDRLLATPVKRSDIVFGYMLSYGIIAIIQTAVIVLSTIWLLNIQVVGNIANVILINFVLALVALSFGILMSTVAKSEFQMMQFIPLIVMPQLFFSGIIPLENMADWAQSVGKILPLYYAGDALEGIILHGSGMADIFPNILFLCVFLILLTTANIVGLKRYRKV
ncbi:ABC transporter permease [Streptococcus uberis]|uniref:ABC transporter permease n=1 Tax=Streptococcus uberis TaxID=1349 RepID=UPI001FF56057|nr:ABC transporter permease [Streptococcus uberis]MCK1189613.1 ABC transporter permease [Streptococcus uberis]